MDWFRCFATGALICLGACAPSDPTEEARKPQQAGKPIDPLEMAGRVALIRGAAIVGDQETVSRQMESIQEDFRQAIRLPDPRRPIEPEAARQAARAVPGVRSVVWLDRQNLFAIVERNVQRSYATIDSICLALEPLGDTLAVVVNLQSGAASNGDELEILSRNCQLPPGGRAMLQPKRQVDVIDPAIRQLHKANNRAGGTQSPPPGCRCAGPTLQAESGGQWQDLATGSHAYYCPPGGDPSDCFKVTTERFCL